MSQIIIDREKFEKLIDEAFKKGESWGVTYSTWFTPTTKPVQVVIVLNAFMFYISVVALKLHSIWRVGYNQVHTIVKNLLNTIFPINANHFINERKHCG